MINLNVLSTHVLRAVKLNNKFHYLDRSSVGY